MYQPYPTAGEPPMTPGPADPPQTVRRGVNLMYAGAALSAIEIITGLFTIGSLKSAIRSQYPNYTASQIHTAEIAALTVAVVVGLLGVGLWIFMARANQAGRGWARIVASVLFAINTIDVLAAVVQPHSVFSLILAVLVWLAGLGAIWMLWQRESSAYIKARSNRVR
ncbi:MAG: hypothetical protein ACR2FU_17515 [Streptosporangiaceae bacterium]